MAAPPRPALQSTIHPRFSRPFPAMGTSRREFLKSTITAAAIAALPASSTGEAQPASASSSTLMFYQKPAAHWMEALPIGNGTLGAMVFGGVESERLLLNDDTLWSGPPQRDWNNPEARQYLPEIRRLLLSQHDYPAADELTRKMQGPLNESYQPLGTLHLNFANTEALPFPIGASSTLPREWSRSPTRPMARNLSGPFSPALRMAFS